jgi:hypothetical protein
MGQQMLERIGLGSYFNTTTPSELRALELDDYLNNYELFYTGRHAVKYIIDALLLTRAGNTIWLPNYYCQHVTRWMHKCYSNISFYEIEPFSPEATFSLDQFTEEQDIVILNNFWGLYTYTIPNSKNRPVFIEDHSHGWLSNSCLHSQADYCFASLRKTLPIPLSGIAWSKTNHLDFGAANTFEQESFIGAWDDMEKAMAMKTALLNGSTAYQKEDYLSKIFDFEHFLDQQHQVVALYEAHKKEIRSYLHKDYRAYKTENLAYLSGKIENTKAFKILDSAKNFTFGLSLVFKDRETLSDVKSYLVKNNIFPAELWPDNPSTSDWKYLINVHTDFRYTFADMDYIAKTLNDWTVTQ